MSCFCLQISLTTDGWFHSVRNPQDRFAAVRTPLERLGGQLQSSFFAVGSFDVLTIAEFPDTVSQSAISTAFAAGGEVASIRATPLMTASHAAEAMERAGIPGYRIAPEDRVLSNAAGL